MPDKIEIHEYTYGGWEVMGDCGTCGHVADDPIHLNLWRHMGAIGEPGVLAGYGGLYKFKRITWSGAALYTNESGEREERHYLTAEKFKRMGQPSHISIDIQTCHPSGAPVFNV